MLFLLSTDLTNQLDGGAWTPLLTETWFGSSDPVTGRIVDGRWENAVVPVVDDDFYTNHGVDKDSYWFPFPSEENVWMTRDFGIHLTNPYGLLRSPWNWNPDGHVARFNSVQRIEDISGVSSVYSDYYRGVTCDDYESFLDSVRGQPLGTLLSDSEDNVHGKIHFTFGGQGGEWAYTTVSSLLLSRVYECFLTCCIKLRIKFLWRSLDFRQKSWS